MSTTNQSTLAPAPTDPYRVLLYYKFVRLAEPDAWVAQQQALGEELGLRGRILVAPEGINGTVSGPWAQTEAYKRAMEALPEFQGIHYKEQGADGHTFERLHVRHKPELVTFRAGTPLDPATEGGAYITPEEMQRLLAQQPEDVVFVDARSLHEYELGHFKGAAPLPIDTFREVPEHLEALMPLQDKTVITYCTGGIRCEKLTPLLRKAGFRDVRQLQGGILHYAEATGGPDFEGACYVFDKRISVPVNQINPSVVGRCGHCGAATEWFINCANKDCNRHFLICEACAAAYQGCCSTACLAAPRRRPWNGTGYYAKPPVAE
jgi:UPF0176 protein